MNKLLNSMAKKTLEKKPEKVFAWADATPEQRSLDMARKRVLAAILGWNERSKQAARPVPLKGENGQHYINRLYNYAKAIACRSVGYTPDAWKGQFGSTDEKQLKKIFNSIPANRLNNIYAEWCKKQNECKNVDDIVNELSINLN